MNGKELESSIIQHFEFTIFHLVFSHLASLPFGNSADGRNICVVCSFETRTNLAVIAGFIDRSSMVIGNCGIVIRIQITNKVGKVMYEQAV